MFNLQPAHKPQAPIGIGLNIAELIYHSIVRSVRKSHNNAFMALGVNMLQTVIFVLAFYVMFSLLGLRGPRSGEIS